MPIPPASAHDTAEDGKPLAPRRPDADECCRGGCETCVFDLYEQEMERYRIALQAWQDAHAHTKSKRGKRK
jgi:hypothetical protein